MGVCNYLQARLDKLACLLGAQYLRRMLAATRDSLRQVSAYNAGIE